MSALTVALLAATLGVAEPMHAGREPRPITLEEALNEGLVRSAAMAVARSELEVTGSSARRARAARWPRVTAEAGWHLTDNPVAVFSDKLTSSTFMAGDFALSALNDPDPADHGMAAVTLEVPLYTFGRIESGIAGAGRQQESARARVAVIESDLIESITMAYFAIPRARAAAAVAESALADARGHEASAEARFASGAALRSDPLRVRARRLSRETDLQRSVADLEMARARLREALSLDPGDSVEPITALRAPEPLEGELGEWLARAEGSRPELVAAPAELPAAREAVTGARAALRPELGGMARYERNAERLDSGAGSFLAGVSLRWTAFDRALSPAVSQADARARGAEASRRLLESRIRLEVEQAWRDARVADLALGSATQAVGAAQAARDITAQRYTAGLLPLTDLLDTETELVGSRLQEIAALYDAVVSRARLERATGWEVAP